MMNQQPFRSHPAPAGSVGTPPANYLAGHAPAASAQRYPAPTNTMYNNNNYSYNHNNNAAMSLLADSSFAQSSAVQQLVPSANAPIDEQVHVLRGALVVTMEEVERLRNAMLVETGKLSQEMRAVVRSSNAAVQAAAAASSSSSSGGAFGTWGEAAKTTDALLNSSSATSPRPPSLQGGLAAAAAQQQQLAVSDSVDVQNRLEYLEQTVRNIQQHQSLHAPVAMENAISQCSIFLRKADQEVQRVVAQMQEKMNNWQRIMDNFVVTGGGGGGGGNNNTNNMDVSGRGMAGAQAIAAGAGLSALNGLDVMADIKRMVQARILELSAYIDQELAAHRSSIITLEDKMGAVIESVSQIETDNHAFRAAVSRPHLRTALAVGASSAAGKPMMAPGGTGGPIAAGMDRGGIHSGSIGTGSMTSPALEDLSSPPRPSTTAGFSPVPGATRSTNNNNNNNNSISSAPAAGGGIASKSGSTAEAIQSLLREFTQVESQVLKDEILKQLDGETSLTRRRLEERGRTEQVSMLRADVVRTVTALETVQEEHTRIERSQQDQFRAFQRLEQQFSLLQHKTDGDIRTELSRLESMQKSFFTRQEQLIAAERQQMITSVTEQVNRMQQKHVEEVRMAERRRMDDLAAAQKQIRDDFVAFAEKQHQDLEDSVQHVKNDFTSLSNQAADNVARALANATDATRRSFMNTTDEMRKNHNKMSDEMRRLQGSVDDSVKRNSEQSSFLQQRLQQVIDEQVVRVDRMGDDLALRLNTAVEEEVKRMTQSSEAAMQRAFGTVDDRQARDAKALREEIAALRQALHAMSAPSSALQSMDARVDALRNDVQEMFETVAALKRNEPRVQSDTRREVNSALETARSEITRNVGLQLQQFDTTLAELHRESLARSQELTALQMRLDQVVQSGGAVVSSPMTMMTMGGYGGGGGGGSSTIVGRGLTHSPAPQVVMASSSTTGTGYGLRHQPQQSQHHTPAASLPGGSGNVMPPATPTGTGPLVASTGGSSSSVPPKRDALQGAFDP